MYFSLWMNDHLRLIYICLWFHAASYDWNNSMPIRVHCNYLNIVYIRKLLYKIVYTPVTYNLH